MRDSLTKLTNFATSGFALIGAIGIIAMLLHVTGYVVLRHVVSAPIPATIEIVSSYYMVLIAFLPLAWVEWRDEMISVEIVGNLFKGALKRINTVFVLGLCSAAYTVLAYTTFTTAMREFGVRSFVISLNVALPIWPSYFILPVAFALAAIISAIKIYLTFTEAASPSDEDGGKPQAELSE